MKTAIVGSRGFEDYPYLAECLDKHPVPITKIVSGGAKGADELAHRYANERGISVEIYLPQYGQYGKSAPLKRNIQIVEASEQLIAFWDGKIRGTAFTIKEARKRDIAVFVMYETQPE